VKTIVVVCPDLPPLAAQPTRWRPSAEAFKRCFAERGWKVKETTIHIREKPDLVAGYGWRPVMREAHQRWPEIVLHCDLGFWLRDQYMKLALGDRWSPLANREFDEARLKRFGVKIEPTRTPGRRVLVCGMSAKAAGTWNLELEQWERQAVKRLRKAGAKVTYRPKPQSRRGALIADVTYDQGRPIEGILAHVDAVVSHHSNAAIDAIAAGLPIFVETGISRAMSVATIEDAVGAQAHDHETRMQFLRQIAWHQFTITELANGTWLEPPAPLADHPLLVP
jgi:hypothetical protein